MVRCRQTRGLPRTSVAFTLIELLVVIAIIALLLAILLPSLCNARFAARKTISLSNIRQITAAANVYKEDYKQFMPLTLAYTGRYDPPLPNPPSSVPFDGWCTWSYGGKNCHRDWAVGTGMFDIEAADRPLNPYVYPEVPLFAPPPPARLQASAPERTSLQLDVYRSPLDTVSYQHGNFNDPNGPAPIQRSSYDDVGTSYHFNVKWFEQLYPRLSFPRAFSFGCERLRLSDAFQPSRMVWLNDQTADVVVNNPNPSFRLSVGGSNGSCRDINKAVMGFMDGHAAYHIVRAGNVYPRNYITEWYSFVFEDLRLPTN